jgi:hypothetical protein
MLTEMLNKAEAPASSPKPSSRRVGCHMALLSALLDGNVFGPLTVCPHSLATYPTFEKKYFHTDFTAVSRMACICASFGLRSVSRLQPEQFSVCSDVQCLNSPVICF